MLDIGELCVKEVVIGHHDAGGVFEFYCFIEKHLAIAKIPVSEHKHQNGSIVQDLKSSVIKLIVHQWRLLVEVCKLESFNDVHVRSIEAHDLGAESYPVIPLIEVLPVASRLGCAPAAI